MNNLKTPSLSTKVSALFLVFLLLLNPSLCFAADAVTLVFKSGQIVKLKGGYDKIISQVKSQMTKSSGVTFIELNLEGETALINLDGIALICRDDCKSVSISHQQDPARAKK